MKKRILPLVLLFVFVLANTAQAVEPRATNAAPYLTFNGTTANCVALCSSNGDDIDVTMTLYQGTTYVASWSATGTSQVYLSKTCTVNSNTSYKLVLSYSINGQAQPSITIYNTSP